MNYWLLKTEPEAWSWEDQVKKGIEPWNGVRNYQARNNMKAMELGDIAFFYHTGGERKIVGLVEIVKTFYPDEDENFVVVDVKTIKPLQRAVSLNEIKNTDTLKEMALVKHGRLSVMSVKVQEFKEILLMGNTNL